MFIQTLSGTAYLLRKEYSINIMKHILLITTRSIYRRSGEQRLIQNRADALRELYGVDTSFIAFTDKKRFNDKSTLLRDFEVETIYFENFFDIISKYLFFIKSIKVKVKTKKYDCIILSGFFLTNIAKTIKKIDKNAFIVADIHGTIKELIEFNPGFKRSLLYLMLSNYEKKMLRYVDDIFVVTNELKQMYLNKTKKEISAHIIPCALENKDYNYKQVMKYRKKWRAEFGVSDNEILFIYSGGNSPWQSIDEAYNIFSVFKRKYSESKFLIMSNSAIDVKYEDVIYRSFSADKVFEVLFAGDVGFLIRSNSLTNKVAFPNKYLEYVRANLEIISTPYLSDISKEIKNENIGMILDKEDSFNPEELFFKINHREYKNELKRRRKICDKYNFNKTLSNFVQEIKTKIKEKQDETGTNM